MYQFIKPFLDNKMSIFEGYGAFNEKKIATLFSRTVRITKLKPGIHMDIGLIYCVYRKQGQEPITLYRFLRSYESSTVEIWYAHSQWAVVSCLPESGPRAYNSWLHSLIGFTNNH